MYLIFPYIHKSYEVIKWQNIYSAAFTNAQEVSVNVQMFHSQAIQADTFFILSYSSRTGVTPGIFQRGPDSSDEGLKHGF